MSDEIQRLRAALETAESACAGYRETIGAQAETILRLARIEEAARNPELIASLEWARDEADWDRKPSFAADIAAFLEAIGERP